MSASRITTSQIKLLGTNYDAVIAQQLNMGYNTIRKWRNKLGIPPYRAMFKWTPDVVDLLGTMPDAELAFILNISYKDIWAKRKRMGISRCKSSNRASGYNRKLKPVEWTDELISKLGKVPDTQIAKKLGRSTTYVRYERIARGIKAYDMSIGSEGGNNRWKNFKVLLKAKGYEKYVKNDKQ